MTRYVAVVGPADASEADRAVAWSVGAALAARGAVVVCGGGRGVMAAVAAGVHSAGGVVVGLLAESSRTEAPAELTVAVATGLGETRNALVVRAADAVIAVGGSWGTLSEVALAVRTGRPVVAVGGWRVVDPAGAEVPGHPALVATAEEAVAAALSA